MEKKAKPKEIEQMPIDALIPFADNARTHSPEQVAEIAASIREFGFNAPILIDQDNGVIAGHGRLEAARKLGWSEVPCLRLSHLSPEKRRLYIIADNRLAEKAGWSPEILSLELRSLENAGVEIALAGFSEMEIQEMEAAISQGVGDGGSGGGAKPEIEFSPELLLSHNYVILYFNNDLDWQVAQEKLGLKQVSSGDPAEKCRKVGIGRVIPGAPFIERLPS